MTLRLAALVSGLLLLATACGNDVPTVPAERQIVAVGIVGALNAEPGASIIRGAQIAIGEYNGKADSTFEARLVRVNTDGKPETMDQATQKLVDTQRIIGAVGALSADESAQVGSVLSEASIPFIVPNVQSLRIPLDGWTSFRRLISNDRQEGSQLTAELARRFKGPAFIVHTADRSGSAIAEGARAQFDRLSRPIVKIEQLNAKSDLGGLSAAIVKSGAQVVVFGGDGQVGKAFGANLKKAGYKGAMGFTNQVMGVKSSSLEVPEGAISSSGVMDRADSALASFRDIHRRRFSDDPAPFAVESYEGTLMLLEAIQEVEARPREITEFLRLNRSFRGDSKEYSFDERGDLLTPLVWLYEARGTWRFMGRSSPFDQSG